MARFCTTCPGLDTASPNANSPHEAGCLAWRFTCGHTGRNAHQFFTRARRRATDWLCSWHTRDWLTSSTAPISRRFSSCS